MDDQILQLPRSYGSYGDRCTWKPEPSSGGTLATPLTLLTIIYRAIYLLHINLKCLFYLPRYTVDIMILNLKLIVSNIKTFLIHE